MSSVFDEAVRVYAYARTDVDMQVSMDKLGRARIEPKPPEVRADLDTLETAMGPMAAFAPDIDVARMTGEEFVPDEQLLEFTAGVPKGMVEGTLGLPGDIYGLASAYGKAVGYSKLKEILPEDYPESSIMVFAEEFGEISKSYGTEYFSDKFDGWLDKLPIDEATKENIRLGSGIGQFFSIPGAGFATAAGVKGIKAGAKTVASATQEFIEGAPARVAARQADKSVQLNAGVDVPAAVDQAIVAMQNRTPPIERDELVNVLRLRADQMRLAPKDRIQPSGEKMFDTSPEAYVANLPEQAETPVPRALPNTTLPKGNRAAVLVEKQDIIAQQLAERMKPYLGTPAQYFYNTGPIIQKAIDLGVPEDVARQQLKRFALNYAATSPRTMTEQNLRNASLVTAKQERGVPIEDVIGPGGEGMNEKGYPMMIGPSGIHRKLVDAAAAEGIDFNTNPKPATFAENVAGNLSGVTVDTHAIRGVLDAMNEIEPGSIPEGFIKKEFRDQYKSDPSSLDPATMIDDELGGQMVDGTKMQTEYAVFSDIYKRAAEILGVSPAEAQSLGWFGSGDRTGLASEMKTVVDLIDDRVDVTAKATGRSKEDVFIDFFSGKIPLLSIGGLTLLETGSRLSNDESETM